MYAEWIEGSGSGIRQGGLLIEVYLYFVLSIHSILCVLSADQGGIRKSE